MSLVLHRHHHDAIRSHLERVYPDEGCGLLVGREGSRRVVERVHPVRNRSARARERHYLIDPEDFLAIEKQARDEGLDVIGFYHSHPDQEPRPSRADRAEALTHYSYLIARVWHGEMVELRSWRLEGDGPFADEALELVASPAAPRAPGTGDEGS